MKSLVTGLLALVLGVSLFLVSDIAVVSTRGNSMDPGFHQGDLAITLPASDYRVGDIAAYHSDQLDTLVMHRIVAVEDARYVLQGDNNSWLDPEKPTDDEMVGRLALRIPQGGVWMQRLTSPPALGLVAFGLLVGGGATVRVRRRGRNRPVTATTAPNRQARSTTQPTSPAVHRLDATTVLGVTVALVVVAGLLAGLAFTRPLVGPGPVEYDQQATFAYAADVPAGPVYPEGTVATGDTVFLNVVDEIDVMVDWRLDPPAGHHAPAAVTGTAALVVTVADGSGWERTLALQDDIPISDTSGTITGKLDLRRIRGLVSAAQAVTGAPTASQTLTLMAEIETSGSVAGQPIQETFRPGVALELDALRLRPAAAADGEPDPFVIERTDDVIVPDAAPATLDVAGRAVPVVVMRAVAVGLLALALVGGVLGLHLRRRSVDEHARIRTHHGHLLVTARGYQSPEGRTIVDLAALEDLVTVAERLQLPVVAMTLLDGSRMYTVDDMATHYRYRPSAGAGRGRARSHRSDGPGPR